MATAYSSRRAAGFAGGLLAALAFQVMSHPLGARQAAGAGPCRIFGRATSGTTPLPGVALKSANAVRATSTETDGGYAINVVRRCSSPN